MTARYYVCVSQLLLDAGTPWHEAGLSLLEQGGFTEPGFRWCLFEDGSAPEELNGKKVELTLTPGRLHEDDPLTDGTRVTGRRVIG